MCDIEQMFYQFSVKAEHRDFLRFLWWDDKDYYDAPQDLISNEGTSFRGYFIPRLCRFWFKTIGI